MTPPRLMYTALASWFHLLTPPSDYHRSSALISELFDSLSQRPVETVLEMGSGGGNNASHLKDRYRMTLTDLSPQMLATSKTLNPECEHLVGDMRTLRLGRTFDAVLVDDAVSYMTTEADLLKTIITARTHLGPGGVAVFCPDETAESYVAATDTGGTDEGDRGMRYLSWSDEPQGTQYTTTFAYIVRDRDGVRVEHETHTFGLFPASTWREMIERAGLIGSERSLPHDAHPQTEQVVFAGVLPAAQEPAPLG